jgi:hypothetical protein
MFFGKETLFTIRIIQKTQIHCGQDTLYSRFADNSSREIATHKLDIVQVQKVGLERGGTEPAGTYTRFYRNKNEKKRGKIGNIKKTQLMSLQQTVILRILETYKEE